MDWVASIIYLLGACAILFTFLPLWRTTRWWVRIWDFPRFQVALASFAIILFWPITVDLTTFDWVFLGVLAAALAWQMSWVWRYVPGTPREVKKAVADADAAGRIALLITNVLQSNRTSARLLPIIVEAEPDVVLAVETDEWWCAELKTALQSRYPHAVQYPLSNGYGLSLHSRLELVEPAVRFVVDEAIPSIRAGVRLRNGDVIDLYCVHPRPPSVQQNSTERDLELVLVGREIKKRGRPALLVGDLNDVAWSPSTMKFKRAGGLLDPRCGRGFFNTYPARWPGLRYPLDYVFNTSHFQVLSMRVLPSFGSDHLPLIAMLRLTLALTDRPAGHAEPSAN